MTGWPAGLRRLVLDSVDSTSAEARRRADLGETGPLWIAARRQTAGRGRRGRHWASAEGNLAATLLMPFRGTPAEAARLGFPAALAVADLVADLAPGAAVTLKWPNDVLLDGRKTAGILLENFGVRPAPEPAAGPGGDRGCLAVAIGIGINLAHHPRAEETRWPATSIAAVTGSAPEFGAALAGLAVALDAWLGVLDRDGFERIRTAWLGRAARLGAPIEARLARTTLTGRFAGIDADGALVIEAADGTRRVTAGDVHWKAG